MSNINNKITTQEMKDILDKVNRNDGMTVPDGYFDDFASRMTASLPQRDWERGEGRVIPRSFWQKVRPYVYLAAMFMGVWCMMKMFDLMRPDANGLSFDNNPVLTAALSNDYFMTDYVSTRDDVMSEYQLMEELYETGFVPTDYNMDFYDDTYKIDI